MAAPSPRRPLDSALAALAFMTRLAPGRPLAPETLSASVVWYAPVGLLIGFLALLPHFIGLWPSAIGIQAWLYIGLAAWITRGLHWDGLMDLADAWGSNATGEKFWAIMKDSRVGAFAVLAVFLLGGGQWCAAYFLLSARIWPPLLVAPLIGRAACVLLLALSPAWPGSTLAQTVKPGANAAACIISLILPLAASFWALGPGKTLLLAVATAALLFSLRRIARDNDGLNGDFLGSVILLTELLTLIVALAW